MKCSKLSSEWKNWYYNSGSTCRKTKCSKLLYALVIIWSLGCGFYSPQFQMKELRYLYVYVPPFYTTFSLPHCLRMDAYTSPKTITWYVEVMRKVQEKVGPCGLALLQTFWADIGAKAGTVWIGNADVSALQQKARISKVLCPSTKGESYK